MPLVMTIHPSNIGNYTQDVTKITSRT